MTADARTAVLVTGGAGNIGLHTARALAAEGYRSIAYDNLRSGFREPVLWGEFVQRDIRDERRLCEILGAHKISLAADPAWAHARLGSRPSASSLVQIVRDALTWRRAPRYGAIKPPWRLAEVAAA